MKTVCRFVSKFSSLIACVLHCFDRVIFKGYLPLSRPATMEQFVDGVLKIRRSDFLKTTARQWSQRLVEHAKQFAAGRDRPFEYHQGQLRKDEWAMAKMHELGIREGLIAVLCTMEACPTYQLVPGEERPRFGYTQIPQRVLYFYFLDRDLGLMHVRLQTWAPFTCQVYVNGHDYLARQLAKRNSYAEQLDNAFVRIDEPQRAQTYADRFAKLKWPKILERYAWLVNPLLHDVLKNMSHYWVTDQAEFATDILFKSPQALAGLFARLLQYACLTFTPKNVLNFFGRRQHHRFDGEVLSNCRTEREPGARIKHRLKGNWLKMYDKFALILRIETVINQPGEFKVYRECQHRDGSCSLGWYVMPKGIGNLHHYQSHALACNQRYLEALAVVDDPTPGYERLRKLTERQRQRGRSYAGFNPARAEELSLFAAVLDGDGIAQGFRNQDIRASLFAQAADSNERRRQSAAVGRLLKRLHIRKLLAKVPRTRRWRVTQFGRHVLGDAVRIYRCYQTQAA
jgi:hypothetical protein